MARTATLALLSAWLMTSGYIVPACAGERGDDAWPAGALLDETWRPYVRADVGYAFQKVGRFTQEDLIVQGGQFKAEDLSDSPLIRLGFGWRLSPALRFDITGEYRFEADVRAVDDLIMELSNPDGRLKASTSYEGRYSALVGLANLYLDLPGAFGVTPNIGAGIGVARNKFSDFNTRSEGSFVEYATGGVIEQVTAGYAGDKTETKLAWALMAGFSVELDQQATIDFGYRYLNLGGDVSASTDLINCYCGSIGSPLKAQDLDAHEILVGLRWEFDTPESAAPLK